MSHSQICFFSESFFAIPRTDTWRAFAVIVDTCSIVKTVSPYRHIPSWGETRRRAAASFSVLTLWTNALIQCYSLLNVCVFWCWHFCKCPTVRLPRIHKVARMWIINENFDKFVTWMEFRFLAWPGLVLVIAAIWEVTHSWKINLSLPPSVSLHSNK